MSCRHHWESSRLGTPWKVVDFCSRCYMVRVTTALLGQNGGVRGEVLGKIHRYFIPKDANTDMSSHSSFYYYSGRYRIVLLPDWEGDPIASAHCKTVQRVSQSASIKNYWSSNF